MGDHDVNALGNDDDTRLFMQALLDDLHALEHMLAHGLIPDGEAHIGAEQELFLIDKHGNPAPCVMALLDSMNDSRFTTEIGQYNLEANLTPLRFTHKCLSQLESELHEIVNLARHKARLLNASVLMCGILPTLQKSHMTLDYMTPLARYIEMNSALSQQRGQDLHVFIQGSDELHLVHDNTMMEASNTSFQLHLQVPPSQFTAMYNLSQALAAPLLASAVNSPLLLGKHLWHETRIALFEQSMESRSPNYQERGQRTRVHFGDDWVNDGITEIFKEDIARFRLLLTKKLDETPWDALQSGRFPKLQALGLHSGTIWRWNRGCYGVNADGIPHVRIESRYLPAGPSILDEVANAALYYGLMAGMPAQVSDIRTRMTFDQAKDNFFNVARYGLNTQLTWLDGKTWSAQDLLLHELLPLAREGLTQVGIDADDRDHYLSIIEERLKAGMSGSQWLLNSLTSLDSKLPLPIRMQTLVKATENRQNTDQPVHQWALADMNERHEWPQNDQTVSQIMKTDLYTVRSDDPVDLAVNIMSWKQLHHLPVEDAQGILLGILSHHDLLQLSGAPDNAAQPVRSVMQNIPITVTPDTSLSEALTLIRKNRIGCLPVIQGTQLVGLITGHDFLDYTELLLQTTLLDDGS